MVLTVRLRGLPSTANSDHIQNFFTGLKIEKEGVNIIGGKHGEALVTFLNSDNTAQAVRMSGKRLLDCPIHISVKYDSLSSPGYVCISFRPKDATLHDIKVFFNKFSVKSVLFCKYKGVRNGSAIVKFEKNCHAEKVLSMFPRNIRKSNKMKKQKTFTVLSANKSREKTWVLCGGKLGSAHEDRVSKRVQASKNQVTLASKWLPEMPIHKQNLSDIHEFYALLVNVSPLAHKSCIRQFLSNHVSDSQITLLYDKGGKRKLECFVMFITEEDYVQALMLDKSFLLGRRVRVLPISKDDMMEVLENKKDKERQVSAEEMMEPDIHYFYLRNFAACANKPDVLNFFDGLSLTDKDICMLYDEYGNSLGETLVKISTKREAFVAEQLNHNRFQDTEILVRRISKEQLKAFGVDSFLDQCAPDSHHSTSMDVCGADVCVTEEDDLPEVTCDTQ